MKYNNCKKPRYGADALYMKHPYNDMNLQKDIIDPEFLIIGSTPPWRFTLQQDHKTKNEILQIGNGDIDFYYGSADNKFWEIIQKIYAQNLKTKENILNFCQLKKLFFTDIVEVCYTNKDKSASDNDLSIVSLNNNIFSVIEKYKKSLKKILFTGKAPLCFFIHLAIANKKLALQYTNIQHEETDLLLKNIEKSFNVSKAILLVSPSKSGLRKLEYSKLKTFNNYKKQNPNLNKAEFRIIDYREAFDIP